METPILFLIFNRPVTTKLVFETIRKAKPKQLFIAADGARVEYKDEKEQCDEARKICLAIDWDCEVKTLFRDQNLGCGLAVSSAISWFFEHVEQGVILEDDCLPIESFFEFAEQMLKKYQDIDQVMMISGTNYFFDKLNYDTSFYFSNLVFIWGWATWKRAWEKNTYDLKGVDLKLITNRFASKQYSKDLHCSILRAIKRELNTWDVQWAYSIFINKGLSIIPIKNQIQNIGYIGTHTDKNESIFFNMPVSLIDNACIKEPIYLRANKKLDLINIKNILSGHELFFFKLQKWLIEIKKKIFK